MTFATNSKPKSIFWAEPSRAKRTAPASPRLCTPLCTGSLKPRRPRGPTKVKKRRSPSERQRHALRSRSGKVAARAPDDGASRPRRPRRSRARQYPLSDKLLDHEGLRPRDIPREGDPTLLVIEPQFREAQRTAWNKDVRYF